MTLATGTTHSVERVQSFAVPEKGGAYVAWLHEADQKDKQASAEEGQEEAETTRKEEAQEEPEEPKKSKAQKRKEKAKAKGTRLVLRHLESGTERSFENVATYAFDERGKFLSFVVSTKEGDSDAVQVIDLSTSDAEPVVVWSGMGDYNKPVFDEEARSMAFLSNAADYESDEPRWSLYLWRPGQDQARVVCGPEHTALPDGWGVIAHREAHFSKSGARLYFGAAPLPEPQPEDVFSEDEVTVDVWHWRDAHIQPMQLANLEEERKRSYLAVAHLNEGARVVTLGSPSMPEVELDEDGEGPFALATSDLPYRRMLSWDPNLYRDAWCVDVATGQATQILRGVRGRFDLSPGGRWVSWWGPEQRAWMCLPLTNTKAREVRALTAELPQAFYDEDSDTPTFPRPYGAAGWLSDDAGFIVYDRYDLWRLDPHGKQVATCVTEGLGRERETRLRLLDLDSEHEAIDESEPLLLSAFDRSSKDGGFWRDSWRGGAAEQLWMDAASYGRPMRAEEAERLVYTRESFRDFPDLWSAEWKSDPGRLTTPRIVSGANESEQTQFHWGTAELTHWTSTDGRDLEGIVYKPDAFDPERSYPLIVYFYERNADNLHRHHAPIVSRSTIRISYYTSRGYVVFVPDIRYERGHPGRSAEQCVLSGVLHMIDQGWINKNAIGVQGHSWGGYQIAWLVTQTDLFRAAVAGAPVSNMTSAYGGVRWGTGMSRMFQYERTQSRIGGTLWDETQRYLDNSPLFFADQVATPLLMLHNDQDGAVPWYQGIEFFLALRRLDKPSWLLNYNGEEHGIKKHANRRDYATRMSQFFDHYLRGAPAPRWLSDGVPAIEKGRSLGLEVAQPIDSPN